MASKPSACQAMRIEPSCWSIATWYGGTPEAVVGQYAEAMFDERPDIQERLHGDLIAWMTTVSPGGWPQTSPVWFLLQDDVIIVFSLRDTPRTRNIAANPKVCLNLNSTATGGEVVIIEGTATIVDDGPSASAEERYVAKYEMLMEDMGSTPQSFANDYPVRIHITPTRLRAS
jgi:PPOX class probable F420-dependent enzyme